MIAVAVSFADVVIPNTFTTGTPALADQVNENFTVLADAVNEQIALTMGLNSATAIGQVLTWDGENWIAKLPAVQQFTIDNMQPFTVVNFIIALQGIYPSRNQDPFIAEIVMFGGNFAPRGWALCDGQLLAISQNTALFSLLGTTYGGDGRTTFGLPDLRGRVPVHAGNGPGLSPRPLGQKSGTETNTIVVR
jgi:microcystin-dependent protein